MLNEAFPSATSKPCTLHYALLGGPSLKDNSKPALGELIPSYKPFSPAVPAWHCYLHAVVVCAFPVQVAAMIVNTAVVQWAETHEAVLKGIVTLLVHVVMPDHILLTCESLVVKGRCRA